MTVVPADVDGDLAALIAEERLTLGRRLNTLRVVAGGGWAAVSAAMRQR